jgi:hypothetical protein
MLYLAKFGRTKIKFIIKTIHGSIWLNWDKIIKLIRLFKLNLAYKMIAFMQSLFF